MPAESPNTPESTHELRLNTEQRLEGGVLYGILTYRGELASWNWAFFVPDPSADPIGTSGTIFHVVLDHDEEEEEGGGGGGRGFRRCWKFEVEACRDVISSPLVVAIFRLADVSFLGDYEDVVGPDSLLPMFKTVGTPRDCDEEGDDQWGKEFSSRTWFLDAICVLHDCGVVQCDDVWLLEREIRRCAFMAMDRYMDNKGWTAYKSERCG